MKNDTSFIFRSWFSVFFVFSSRVLAGVLPPAGQNFEKLHFLEIFVNFGAFLVPSKHGSSRGAASGGPEF